MATRLLERVPVERIQAEARPVDIGRLFMVAVIAVFYALGFIAAKIMMGLGMLFGWIGTAAKTGWQEAHLPVEERHRARSA